MRALLGILLIGLGFLGHLYFSHYTGNLIPQPFLLVILSWFLIFCGACLLYFFARGVQEKIIDHSNQWNEYLKTKGEKIPVEFADCEIKENPFFERSEGTISRGEAYVQIGKALFNEPEYPSAEQSRYSTILSYSYTNPKSGSIEVFNSDVITKDKITLSFLLEEKKSTFIYVDRNNRKKYFFDLDFLS